MKRLLILLSAAFAAVPAFAQSAGVSVAPDSVLTLQQCLDSAVVRSIYARKASLDVLAARAQQSEARWAFVPSVSLTSLAYDALNPLLKVTLADVLGSSDAAHTLATDISARAYENGIKPYYETLSRGYGFTATVVQPLFAGGRIVSGNRLADLGVKAASLQEDLALKSVSDSVESKYWRIVALQRKGETVDEALSMLDSIEKDLRSAVSAGLVSQADLSELGLKQGELRSAKYRLDGSLVLLKMDLMDYVGCSYDALSLRGLRLEEMASELPSPEEVFAAARPVEAGDEAKLLDLQVEAKQTEKKMAVGEYLPQVAVGASYGYGAMMLPQDGTANGMVFAMVRVPLTDLGKASARARRYDYEVQKAQMDRDYLMSRLRLRDEMLRLELETLWLEIGSAEEGVAYAQDCLAKERVRLSAGQSTASAVLRAALALTTARETLLTKQTAYLSAAHTLGYSSAE